MELMLWQLPMVKVEGKINLTFQFYFKDRRRDPDSVMFTVKCFLDAMVKKGIIENDGQNNIGRITFEPVLIGEERVEVRLSW
jgi:Holliday junction resolvase RusA-like endonuclease